MTATLDIAPTATPPTDPRLVDLLRKIADGIDPDAPTLTPDQIADVLDDAADYIERYGWERFTDSERFEYGMPGCALAGIAAVEGRTDAASFYDVTMPVVALWRELPDLAYVRVGGPRFADRAVYGYNDVVAPDAQHMLDLMRAAAKTQRRKGEA